MNEKNCSLPELGITTCQINGILELRKKNLIGSSSADKLFDLLCDSDFDAASVAEREGLLQINDEGSLAAWVKEAIANQPQAAEDVKSGKDAAVGRLIGEAMKCSGGSADAAAVRAHILKLLRS